AAGGQFASSRVTLQETLARLTLEVDTRQIVDPIDAGAIQNPNVLRQLRAKWRLLAKFGYTVRIAWWGQITKANRDIDELADFTEIEYLTIAQFETLAAQYNGRGWQWLQRLSQRLARQPDPLRSAAALQQDLGEPESEVFTFQPGDRLKAYQTAIEQGHRYILDRSVTGTGKSFDTGNLTPDLFGSDCRQIIYASDQHRNPTVETLSSANGWVDLEARHGGLVQETTPNGNTRWKRANGEVPNLPANCNRIQLIGALRAKHVSGADTASLICGGCPLREACSHAEGQNYGFLHQRRSALSATKLRAHPDSLPSTSDYDYEGVVLVADEPGQIFQTKQALTVTEQDLTQTVTTLMHHPQLFTALQPLLTILLSYLDGTERTQRYGMSHTEVLKQLINPAISIAEVEQALQPDLSYLNVTQQYGVDAADLPPSLRKRFAERDAEMANQTEQKIIKQWLPDLLRVLSGATGHLHLERRTLTISLPNTRQRAIFQAAQAAVFLDATLSREDLALKLGCQPSEIFVCHQAVPQYSNLTIAQVTDLGRLGMQRGAEQQRRSAAIVAHYQALDPATKVIDFKRHAAAGWGAWWRDSRGVNDFEQVSRLILIGTPCRNLADLLAEYAVLTGVTDAEDPGFQSFVDRAIRADMVQAIGRLRAHRRPDEPLEVIVLSDFDVGLPSIQRLKASEITLEAADRWECFTMAVQGAVTTLKATGKKVTQTAIAAISGYSQQYISRCWKLLQTLLEASNSVWSKNSDPPVESELVEVANAAIAECETVTQTIESVADIFWEWLEPGQQTCFWQSLTRSTQMQILEALLLMLPEPQIAFLNPKLTHAKGSET
ncbi:hypothetical protein H6F43_02980, partial [Leptolyngbya sp. FACHB-36]|uniref:hypothetical protein n=1 Tax=Leptolyngbya sp. FACHB-36 TaxID=2692808 RepID=UPI0016814420